jgi:quinol monooxygenase YgiN
VTVSHHAFSLLNAGLLLERANCTYRAAVGSGSSSGGEDVELVVVTMAFDVADAPGFEGVAARYVVLTRGHPGCRNVDLLGSATQPGRYLIVQKWESAAQQRAHLDSPDAVTFAESCVPHLRARPDIDLWDGLSAHDLR